MSQTSLKQKKKNEPGMRYSKESLDADKRKDSDKSGARLSTQGSQELPVPNTDSRGYIVRNQWSRTSRSPSTGAPSVVDEPRSRNTVVKVELAPNSSATSRTSSASPSQHETSPPPQAAEKPSVQQTQQTRLVTQMDSQPPTPPEPEPSTRRTSKMHASNDPWTHRDTRDPRDTQLREYAHSCDSRELIPKPVREYPRTPPTEWKSYVQRRLQYGTSVDIDQECMSEVQQRQRQQMEEDEVDEAYWSSPKPKHAITIAVSSRALFNMVDDRKIYEEEGLEKYMEYQLTNENVILTPGPAFRFVKALQHVNSRLRELYPDEQDLFDIVLMTNNHAQVGVRLINSVNHYGLLIDRFCLTGGKSPIGYLKAYLTNLYLSADSEKVQEAIKEGIASATMFAGAKDMAYCDTQLRVAFDGDAVLFSDESEHIAKEHGLDKFFQHEALFENKPLAQGPLKGFLEDLGKLQKKFYAKDERLLCPIRTYLVTARSAASSGARVLKTLRRWGLEIDEALFLAGAPKGPILVKIRPHIFFDDQMFHIESAQKFGTITAHVPYGIAQKRN
ncbi:cytosolic 5'-nucleotidase 1B isoform X8 [Cricetulus griseus]|uniref:Cytosolic 5'-nucleotidase 1B isoform X17 n=1 Tax=Cricetulus griseus TaxID=10029 RepID=A0A9J7KBG3_CRIGR|nr:cytosolic 5'-nucleotidase 1B isoform X17 [Cricetulus griseus]XP_035312167.1 cytosolic 5'-nucleotidase 1B isoform X8 [Cricetulus griseus]